MNWQRCERGNCTWRAKFAVYSALWVKGPGERARCPMHAKEFDNARPLTPAEQKMIPGKRARRDP